MSDASKPVQHDQFDNAKAIVDRLWIECRANDASTVQALIDEVILLRAALSQQHTPQPSPPTAKRVRTSDAVNDIENAFREWRALGGKLGGWFTQAEHAKEVDEAQDRVTTWLTQVAADQRQLHAALLACQALDEANDDVDVRRATALARIAMGTK